MDKILITGASGVLGKELRKVLRREAISYSVAGRKRIENEDWNFLDLKTGVGIENSVKNVELIFHLASSTVMWERDVDVAGTRKLAECAKQNGVKHFIFISIVGTDKVAMKYYRMKAEAEEVIRQSGLSYTILRATQFHELIDKIFSQLFVLPLAFFPKHLKIQAIETRVVAEKLFEISKLKPINGTLNIGGTEILDTGTMARQWIRAGKRWKWLIGMPSIGSAMHSVANGNLTCAETAGDSITWSKWLERKYGK